LVKEERYIHGMEELDGVATTKDHFIKIQTNFWKTVCAA
jgi:hypothetical protein